MEFEADLDPDSGRPRVRMNFDNGWTLSVVFMMPDRQQVRFALASVAAIPTGMTGRGLTRLLNNEANADELAGLCADVAAWPHYEGRVQ